MNELTPDEHNIIVDAIHDSATVIHKGQRMNERIKQITGQVLDEIVPETWVALGYDKIKEIQFRTAELIVRECLTKIENEAAQYAEPVWAFELVNDIKEHFGVKE
jgi:hypothetical protein